MMFIYALLLALPCTAIALPQWFRIPYEKHHIKLVDQATDKPVGEINFTIYAGSRHYYAQGGAFFVLPQYQRKTPVQKIFGDWLKKLPEFGVAKAYWVADPFKIDEQGRISFYHNDEPTYRKALQKSVPFYTAIGGIPERDSNGALVQAARSTSQGMKSVQFHYIVPQPIKKKQYSYRTHLTTVAGYKHIHRIMVDVADKNCP